MQTPRINAGISYQGDGMFVAARSMAAYMEAMSVHADNIAHYAVPGYQAQKPIVRSFVEHLGPGAVERATSETIGRLRRTGQPTDLALESEGYFQLLDPATGMVQTTRDGRMTIDKDGYLLSMDGQRHFLDTGGNPLKLPKLPSDPANQLKVDRNGVVTFYNRYGGDMTPVGRLAVVSGKGGPLSEVAISQGTVEDSNVFLAEEFASILPKRREFEANRQVFILQSDSLSRMIQELGRPQ